MRKPAEPAGVGVRGRLNRGGPGDLLEHRGGTMRLPDETIQTLLAAWPVARLATVGPAGRPHLVPIVFTSAGTTLWSPIDGKPKAGGAPARVRHIRRDPRVTLLLDAYAADWTRLWWVRLDGTADLVTSRDPERDAVMAPAMRALRAKYPQYAGVPLFQAEPTLIRIQVARTRSWCAGAAAAASAAESDRPG